MLEGVLRERWQRWAELPAEERDRVDGERWVPVDELARLFRRCQMEDWFRVRRRARAQAQEEERITGSGSGCPNTGS